MSAGIAPLKDGERINLTFRKVFLVICVYLRSFAAKC